MPLQLHAHLSLALDQSTSKKEKERAKAGRRTQPLTLTSSTLYPVLCYAPELRAAVSARGGLAVAVHFEERLPYPHSIDVRVQRCLIG